jgi:hypothetical protein
MATHGLPQWPWAGAPTDDLPRAERLLLETTRLWAAAARAGWPPLPFLRPPCIAEDAGDAIVPIDALMRAAGNAMPPACQHCPCVAPAEATLLLTCALAQRGARRQAMALLIHRVPLSAARATLPAAGRLGIAFAQAGLLLHNPLRCRVPRPGLG